MTRDWAMKQATEELHRRHPDSEGLILRRGSSPAGKRYWQLHGSYGAKRYSRKLDCVSEFELMPAAERMLDRIRTGSADRRRPGLNSHLKDLERKCLKSVDERLVRETTKDHYRRHVRKLTDWLAENTGGWVSQSALVDYIETTKQSTRTRRGALDAAKALADAAAIKLVLPPRLRFRPLVKEDRQFFSDQEILAALDEVGPKLSALGRSVLGFCAITGQRASFFFSIDPALFAKELEPGNPIPGRDTKRNRLAETTPTMEGWSKYVGSEPPGWSELSFDRLRQPSDAQQQAINAAVSNVCIQLRRKASPEHHKLLGFRSLRANTTARLLKRGVPKVFVAKTLSTSEAMIDATYDSPLGSIASQEIGRVLAGG